MTNLHYHTTLALVFLLAGCMAHAQPLRVTRVIDGDTFETSDGRTVRLIGIDTPETYTTSKLRSDARRSGQDVETIQALGKQATAYAKSLVLGRVVELEYDQNNAPDHEGYYGRTLAYVWVLDESGERRYMVNAEMVRAGYAHAYTKYPSERGEAFVRLERQARREGRGLWGEGLVSRHQQQPARTLHYSPSGPDRDCSHFSSHAQAQAFYEAAGPGDPHRLDGDGDGSACESL